MSCSSGKPADVHPGMAGIFDVEPTQVSDCAAVELRHWPPPHDGGPVPLRLVDPPSRIGQGLMSDSGVTGELVTIRRAQTHHPVINSDRMRCRRLAIHFHLERVCSTGPKQIWPGCSRTSRHCLTKARCMGQMLHARDLLSRASRRRSGVRRADRWDQHRRTGAVHRRDHTSLVLPGAGCSCEASALEVRIHFELLHLVVATMFSRSPRVGPAHWSRRMEKSSAHHGPPSCQESRCHRQAHPPGTLPPAFSQEGGRRTRECRDEAVHHDDRVRSVASGVRLPKAREPQV